MSNFSEAKIKAVAERSWWSAGRSRGKYYISKKCLAEAHNLTEDQIDKLRATRKYRKHVERLMLSQFPTQELFEERIREPRWKSIVMEKGMGIDLNFLPGMIKRVRQANAEIDFGKRKRPKSISDPFKRLENYKYELYRVQGKKCNCCGEIFAFSDITIDHIIPRSRGGTDALENLQLLCKSCNSSKGARMPEE